MKKINAVRILKTNEVMTLSVYKLKKAIEHYKLDENLINKLIDEDVKKEKNKVI